MLLLRIPLVILVGVLSSVRPNRRNEMKVKAKMVKVPAAKPKLPSELPVWTEAEVESLPAVALLIDSRKEEGDDG